MAKNPDQPDDGAKNRQRDKYFPETCDKPDYKNDGEQTEATFTAPATGASSTAMSPMNRDVFPWFCMNMPYTHNYPPNDMVVKNGGADGDRTRKQ